MDSLIDMHESSQIPLNQTLFLFGPPQSGKKTFINNLLRAAKSNFDSEEVKVGDGKFLNLKAKYYNIAYIPDIFPQDKENYNLSVIDIPGIFDTELKLSKEDIFITIRELLAMLNASSIDAILIFESMNENSKIGNTMQKAVELFGESVKESSLVLSTKWDTVDKNNLCEFESNLAEKIKYLELKTMKWQNNTENNFILTEDKMAAQLSKLGGEISTLKPYVVIGMAEILKKINEIANEIRENDPERYTVIASTIENEDIEYIDETITIEKDKIISLSDDEIREQAQKLYKIQTTRNGGVKSNPNGKQIIEIELQVMPKTAKRVGLNDDDEYFPFTHYYKYDEIENLKEWKNDSKIPVKFTDYRYYNLDNYIDLLQGSKKIIKVKKEKNYKRAIMITKSITTETKHEYKFKHYQMLAFERIKNDFVKLFDNL